MTDDFQIMCKNLNFPDIEARNFTETFTIPYMLGVVDVLKGTPAVKFPRAFKNRWEEIKNIVSIQCGLNLDK